MRAPRRLLCCTAAVLLIVGTTPSGSVGQAENGPRPALTLGDVFQAPGPVLRDRNGDGFADFVDAQFVLPEAPSAGEVAAAANIAARLAHESTEMNIPLPNAGAKLSIAIGAGGVKRSGLTDDAAGLAGLLPGEGVVAVAGPADRPVLVIAGRDDDGTQAAGTFVASRVPYAWNLEGATLTQVGADVAATVAAVAGCSSNPVSVVVRADTEAIDRIVTRATCGTAAAALRLQTAVRALGPRPTTGSADSRLGAWFDGTAVKAIRVEIRAPGGPPRMAEARPRPAGSAASPASRRSAPTKEALDLSNLYDIDGMAGDSDTNLIPDRTDVLLVPAGPGTEGTIDLAARLGLESAGVSFPIAVSASVISTPATEPTLVLIGTVHPLIEQLSTERKLDRSSLAPGEGMVRVVRKAFGERSAVVITGSDTAGLRLALAHAAERLPHLWARGKDRPTLEDLEEDLRRFVSGRSPAGQAAIGLYKLDQLLATVPTQGVSQVAVRFAVDHPDPGLASYVKERVATVLGLTPGTVVDVQIEGLDVRSAAQASAGGIPISGTFAVASEVDEFWSVFRSRVLPAVRKGAVVSVEARLSEPRDVRRAIEREALAALVKAGAAPASAVQVLSAYKQGYSWLEEAIAPRLKDKPVGRLTIRFAEAGPPPGWTQQAMFIPTRWLLEVFPIDDVLARVLELDRSRIVFEKAPVGSPTYEVTAVGTAGDVLLHDTFEPATVVRPYFDRFPDYEHVRVATGRLRATMNGARVVEHRITTDLERFWDRFQSQTLPAIYDYVMAQSAGKPRPEDAPHFGTLRVEVSLSEPHEKIGIDQEQISPMEALHEDIYFGVLHFFDVLGRLARGTPLDYPGHIVPVTRATSDGKAGEARITFTGFTVPRPMVVLEYTDAAGRRERRTLDIPAIAVERPSAVGAVVRPRTDGIAHLDVRLKVDSDTDERVSLIQRARAERVDAQVLSAAQVVASLAALDQLRRAGLYTAALAYEGLGTLRVAATWAHDDDASAVRVAALAESGRPTPLPDIRRYRPELVTGGAAPGLAVQWSTPIAPAEAWRVLADMASYPEATVYKAGGTYLGQEIWAMDLTSPIGSSHWSQAKATTLKPTALFSGRQHANEVSSTSHLLTLAERLLTVPEQRKILDKVNVVIHPITNADGAQLAHDLWADTPDYMLHAAYLGSLGVDVAAAQWETDAIYPESRIRAQLWRTWLPDLFLNPHGYPSHEWVQPFSEYAAWVRSRVTESRDWWGMRGWFMPGFAWIDDPKYPRHKEAALELRRRMAAAINGRPEVKALNERAYDRYRRYGFAWNQVDFKLDFTDGVLIYSAVKGSKPNPRGNDPMLRQPNITIWSGTTEAPDEPAWGEWLTLVAGAGLAWDEAVLSYLAEGRHVIEHKREPFRGGATLSLHRARPPKAVDGRR